MSFWAQMGLSADDCPIMAVATNRKTKGKNMAGNGDMKAHEETYAGVMNLLKWGTIGSCLVGALVIILIST